jgi:proliferating cell nuclear antigen
VTFVSAVVSHTPVPSRVAAPIGLTSEVGWRGAGFPLTLLAKSATPNEWKAVAASVQALVEEAAFEATPEGLTFRAMDPSHVALIDLLWPKATFERFECDKAVKFAVRVEDFTKLIRRADARDTIELSMPEEQLLLLRLANGYKREYQLHLIESTAGPTPLPKIAFKAKLAMPEHTFERILSDVSAVSDHVTMETTKEKVAFAGKSDTGKVAIAVEKGSADVLELEVTEESKATYSIDYLVNIVKAAGAASDTVLCEFSSKMPLRLEFKLAGQGGRIHFYLAPRIEER